jgi:hypothetical protein
MGVSMNLPWFQVLRMNVTVTLSALFVLFHAGVAHAKCETLTQGIANLGADQLVAQYKQVMKCDIKTANQVFPQFMRAAGDTDTLVALSLAAIDADVWNPVWEMIGKLTSYDVRDEVANRVGMTCASDPKVVGFLKGAYFALRDIDFLQWDDALVTCEDTEFQNWLVEQVGKPPPKLYDDKWGALMAAVVHRLGPTSLPLLAKAGIAAAANGGPLDAILAQMDSAVAPALGYDLTPENRQLLEETLVGMARQLPPEKALAVADRLATSGSDARAAELLPIVYPGRQQNGFFAWGGASIEAGTCNGQKQAIVHYAAILEPGKRWIMTGVAEPTLKDFKPKLTAKCQVTTPWPVVLSTEPLKSATDAATWALSVVKTWEEKGFVVKTKDEKTVELP